MANALQQKEDKRSEAHALFGAAGEGDAAAVVRLLASGVSADVRLTPGGETPLMRAAARGHAEVARELLDAGADPSARRADGFTPLILAVFFGHEWVARLLVERGADARARTNLGTTAARWAASRGFAEMADLLRGAEAAVPPPPDADANATKVAAMAATPQPDEVGVFSRKGGRRGLGGAVTVAHASTREAAVLADAPVENTSRSSVSPASSTASNEAPPDPPSSGAPATGVSLRLDGQLPAHPSASTFRLGHFLRSWQGSVGVALLLLACGVAVFALMRGGTASRGAAGAAPPAEPAAPQVAGQPPTPPATQPSPAFPTPDAQSVPSVTDPANAVPSAAAYPFYVPPVSPGPPGQSEVPRALTVVSESGAPSNEEAGPTKRKPEASAGETSPAQGEVGGNTDADARAVRATRTPEPEQRAAPPALPSTPSAPTPQPSPGRPKVIQWPPQ